MAGRVRALRWVRRFPVTLGIAALTLVFFALEYFSGGTMDVDALLRLGAMRPDRVSEHREWYRLVLPMLLHAGPVHLALNGFALLQLGALVESLWGGRRLLVFYVVSGVAGALTSAALNPPGFPLSVGSSGAVLGLAGVVVGATAWGAEPARTWLLELVGQRLLASVALTFAIGIGLWLVLPAIDNWAHAGGFACGLALSLAHPDPTEEETAFSTFGSAAAVAVVATAITAAALEGQRALETVDLDTARILSVRASRQPGAWTNVGLLLEMADRFERAGASQEGLETLERHVARLDSPTALTLLAGTMMLERDAGRPYDEELDVVLKRWLEVAPDDAHALNTRAWHLVTRGDAEARDPVAAEPLSRRSLERIPDPDSTDGRRMRAAFLDTLGEVLLQLGRLDEALAVQRESVALARELALEDLAEIEARLARIEAAGAG